ncbi:MAG: hypothetical protein HOV71_05775 [Hamadaea sp.]|nr:hypothetical protein [Hamadaea sp.]NUT05465.1 hypothetical protein [Hamadaea sp.]
MPAVEAFDVDPVLPGDPFDVGRRLRFIGVTIRTKTSPKTFRWQQAAEWTRDLPARSVLNVSLDRFAWSYFAGGQTKLTDTFRPDRWLAEIDGPSRGDEVSQALAEALAVVAYGRTRTARSRLVQAMTTEPAMAEPWLRQLVGELGRTPATAD